MIKNVVELNDLIKQLFNTRSMGQRTSTTCARGNARPKVTVAVTDAAAYRPRPKRFCHPASWDSSRRRRTAPPRKSWNPGKCLALTF